MAGLPRLRRGQFWVLVVMNGNQVFALRCFNSVEGLYVEGPQGRDEWSRYVCLSLLLRRAQRRRRKAAAHGAIVQEISEHPVAEGPADERCHHHVSEGQAATQPIESAKDFRHY
jgi:hypothetical protein